ncbi:calmodulin-domain kinase (macronuclear) [Tetrahymena thermophila SB210]|uniref:non-specific serine/threonine protein kinase n=1 Tax=Tetrahymena thermophila (strain SB210) TaxID=312017 RepID=Q234C7_TETTS|nr:calmodulin-domain kinase [Tetrahymena thermophila SB210]EAR92076.3 calmodulin-domain kinase [Tetrahymena thermophila SB210]|eukprot:XP_001012321.3 calmodulin-domain kinase [Tetrahymena thermophila SB210]
MSQQIIQSEQKETEVFSKNANEESDHSSQTYELCGKRYNSNHTESESYHAYGEVIQKKRKTDSPKQIKFEKNIVIDEIENLTQKYEKLEVIGEGGFGVVYKVLDRETKLIKAMKRLKKNSKLIQTDNELELLKRLDHPNIIRIFDFYQDEEDFYIITEYIEGGCLFDEIQKLSKLKQQFNEYHACQIMQQILMAVNYAHSINIVHRDLKAENVLIQYNEQESRYHVKVIDWGLSVLVEHNQKLHIDCGTSYFKAPEVINRCYDEKCDLWSCGALMYELLSGCPPFDAETDDEIEEKILQGGYSLPTEYFGGVSVEAIDLLKKLLTYIPSFRISAKQALEHSWFKKVNNKDLSQRSLMKGLNRMRQFKADKFMLKYIMTFFAIHTMSPEENNQLTNLFNQIDKDQDGKISHEEMAQALKSVYNTYKDNEGVEQTSQEQLSDDEISEIINHIDFNQNGEIEYTEFLVAAMRKYTLQNEEFLYKVFDIFDKDGDGFISLQEVKDKLQNNLQEFEFDSEVWNQIIKEVDEDGDKEISFDEFKSIINTYFIKNDYSNSQAY